jgi:hypothetical protein
MFRLTYLDIGGHAITHNEFRSTFAVIYIGCIYSRNTATLLWKHLLSKCQAQWALSSGRHQVNTPRWFFHSWPSSPLGSYLVPSRCTTCSPSLLCTRTNLSVGIEFIRAFTIRPHHSHFLLHSHPTLLPYLKNAKTCVRTHLL